MRLLSILLLLFAFVPQAFAKNTNGYEHVAQKRELNCAYAVWAPYFMKDANTGAFSGITYDLMEAAGKSLGLKINWTTEIGPADMFVGLDTGKYDAICMPVWDTPTTAFGGEFTVPIFYSPIYAFARSDDIRFAKDAEKAINSKDIKIVDVEGNTNQDTITFKFPQAKTLFLSNLNTGSDVLMNVMTKKADVSVQNAAIVEDFMKKNPGALKRVAGPLNIFPTSLAVVPKGDFRLKAVLDKAATDLLNSGRMDQILDKYDPKREIFLRVQKPYQ